MSETGRSILVIVIFSIILFAALAILVSPEFAQAIAVIVILMVIAGLAKTLSEKK